MKRVFCAVLLLSLSACGYHLRGSVDFPQWFNSVSIIAKNNAHSLVQKLESRLQGYNIRVLLQSETARYLLVIEDTLERQQISAVSSTTIPRQYQLTYLVHFKLVNSKTAEDIVKTSVVSVARQLTVNNDRILGSDNEEALLMEEMRSEAVMQMISRLSHQLARIHQ